MSAASVHPAVRTNHRIRSAAFVLAFALIASHIAGQGYPSWVWLLLALQFFVYPMLVYWRARHATDPLRTELQNLLIDPLLLGAWCAALGYPLWITFALLSCAIMNRSFYRGQRGGVEVIPFFFLTGIVLMTLGRLQLSLHTDDLTTALSATGLVLYILITTNTAYMRNVKLRDTRKRLVESEHALNAANEALQQQIGEVRILQAQLREQANRDPLTGLYNRRYFDTTLERELSRCKREGLPLSLMLIDIDHFKRVNDTYGHQAGDEILKQLARLLEKHARSADVPCRFGGEEFLMLLPGMPSVSALERAENWRRAFAELAIRFGEFPIHCTLSIGIATYPGHGKSLDELIGAADQAMYRAKAEGRNRVVLQPTDAPPA